jgi:hypothetical protein
VSDTRKKAIAYLRRVVGEVPSNLVSASKFFEPSESWTGKEAWWFDLPIEKIKRLSSEYYYLLGEWGRDEFVILKVPNHFLLDKKSHFDTKYKQKIRLHLAAHVDEKWLVDERVKNGVPFARFVLKKPLSCSR